MSWISDVRDEVRLLRSSRRELKKFGLIVGSVFFIIGGYGYFRSWPEIVVTILLAAGILLLLAGAIIPDKLKHVHRIWMGAAFAIGWLVSRLILVILFYFVLVPVGFVARILGKEFVDADFRKQKESYWIPKSGTRSINYEKMF